MRMTHRFAAMAGSLALALGGVCFSATTAHATAQECQNFLLQHGYADSDVAAGCAAGAQGDIAECVTILALSVGVETHVAVPACALAAQPA
ncbi:hypothetical protein RB201_28300 [Streptomyces sp. S1A(2023)]